MTAPVLEFNEALHTYTVEGVTYPSITQVIEAAGLVDYSQIPEADLDFYKARGTALHQAAWYSDEGDLNEATVDPLVRTRLDSWRKFRRDLQFKILLSEARRFDRQYGFAGTPDRLVQFPNGTRGVIELKSGPVQPAAAVQTAAQCRLLEVNGEVFSLKRFAVHLRADGEYSVKEFFKSEYPQDLSTFLSALTVYRWRAKNL